MTDPKALADAIDPRNWPRVGYPMPGMPNYYAFAQGDLIAASNLIRTLLSRIEELESAAALAGKIAIEEAARYYEDPAKLHLTAAEKHGSEADRRAYERYTAIASHIRSLSKPIDRNALIERGARALAHQQIKNLGRDADADWVDRAIPRIMSSELEGPIYRAFARAILSSWIGEETK